MEAAQGNPAIQATLGELIALRRELRGNPLRPRRAVRGLLAGAHHSRFRGRGMDYLESRLYQPGDDIRNLDWRVTARSGKAHTKLYQEERERPVVVLVDLGPGMFFATRGRFKSVIAARAASFLGWSAVAHGDRIGALLFNGEHRELKPRGGDKGSSRRSTTRSRFASKTSSSISTFSSSRMAGSIRSPPAGATDPDGVCDFAGWGSTRFHTSWDTPLA